MTNKTRTIERDLVIDADPATVWRTITSAEEIGRWFAPFADSVTGVGGHIDLSWMEGESLSRCHITEWNPPERLRMSWRDAPGGTHELPVEITLESRGGSTFLRLVHSGFLSDASWDDEFDSHARGWTYELRSLKYYIEEHLGRDRRFTCKRYRLEGDPAVHWRELVGPSGAFGVALDGLAEGADFLLDLPTGELTRANLVLALKDRDFVATAAALQGGIFRLALEFFTGTPEIWVWAFSWQHSEEDLKTLMTPIYAAIESRLRAG